MQFPRLKDICACQSDRMRDLVEAAGADPSNFFVGADFSGLDLRGEDLRGFCLDRATFKDAIVSHATLVDPKYQHLISEGRFVNLFIFNTILDSKNKKKIILHRKAIADLHTEAKRYGINPISAEGVTIDGDLLHLAHLEHAVTYFIMPLTENYLTSPRTLRELYAMHSLCVGHKFILSRLNIVFLKADTFKNIKPHIAATLIRKENGKLYCTQENNSVLNNIFMQAYFIDESGKLMPEWERKLVGDMDGIDPRALEILNFLINKAHLHFIDDIQMLHQIVHRLKFTPLQ